MFSASMTRVADIDLEAFHPTMRRLNTSITNATYTTPDHVEQYVKSHTHFWFGALAVKSRPRRSGERAAAGSAWVVKRRLARLAPRMPVVRISRATWSRPRSWPALRAALVSLRRP
jgi:hypothetical protein